ncbi:MAG: ABC transporter ATP-binding protein [Firmicutes bacterium]|nr:ABC transporter ATP-binding protein [Bacillota bacterium]
MSEILRIRDLAIDFNTSEGIVSAVRGVDLKISEGEVLGLVGESGCGKSVTSLAVMGLLPKPEGVLKSGQIIFENKNLTAFREEEWQKIRGNEISMIFQEPMTALNPVLTIGDQLGEVLQVHKGIRLGSKENIDICVENLIKVGIPRPQQVLNEYPHQFSGGMRQRIMIAMALSCDPKLIIADEPTTALDVTIQAQILDLLRELKETMKTSILFITHDLGVIHEMADRVMVMYAGKIVEEGPTKELFANPSHPYTQGLMHSRPGKVKKGDPLYCIPGMVPSGRQQIIGCAFEPRCQYSFRPCKTICPLLEFNEKGHGYACHLSKEGGIANVGKAVNISN